MCRVATILFVLVTIFASNISYAAENLGTRTDLRPALPEEIIGVWFVLPTIVTFWRHRYLVVTTGGRLGWVLSQQEPAPLTSATIIKAIESGSILGGQVVKFRDYAAKEGYLSIKTGDALEEFWIKLLPNSEGQAQYIGNVVLQAGDLYMWQIFRAPPRTDEQRNEPPVHVQTLPPMYLRRLTQ